MKKKIKERENALNQQIEELKTKLFISDSLILKIKDKVDFYSSLKIENQYDKGFNKAFEIINSLFGGC